MNHLLLIAEGDDRVLIILIPVVIALLVVTVITVLSRRYERSRRDALAEIARANGHELVADEGDSCFWDVRLFKGRNEVRKSCCHNRPSRYEKAPEECRELFVSEKLPSVRQHSEEGSWRSSTPLYGRSDLSCSGCGALTSFC